MNKIKSKKAQMNVGMIILLFITLIVGLILFQDIAQFVGQTRDTAVIVNDTFTAPANGGRVDLTGQEFFGSATVYNATGQSSASTYILGAGNYTIDERVSPTTGVKTVYFQLDDALFENQELNISYDYGPDGYMDNSGGRSMAGLIIIFTALVIAVVAMSPVIREGLSNLYQRVGGR